jgi:hypothetical protein
MADGPAIEHADVQAAFEAYPDNIKRILLGVRFLIFETAAGLETVGEIEECLKWGQPSYLTVRPKTSTTVRLGMSGGTPAVFVHCQTNLIEQFKAHYPEAFSYEGKRALLLPGDGVYDRKALAHCLAMALTYHVT